MFKLDSRLEKDTIHLTAWPLCEVLLVNDTQFPWVILVPKVSGATELYHLDPVQRQQLDAESVHLSKVLMAVYSGDKLNVAALGNVVSQLHIHHVVRFEADAVWPAPVWGKLAATPLNEQELAEHKAKLFELTNPKW